jgi:hypothetical protein
MSQSSLAVRKQEGIISLTSEVPVVLSGDIPTNIVPFQTESPRNIIAEIEVKLAEISRMQISNKARIRKIQADNSRKAKILAGGSVGGG